MRGEDQVHLLIAQLLVDILGLEALVGREVDQRAVGGAGGALNLRGGGGGGNNQWEKVGKS